MKSTQPVSHKWVNQVLRQRGIPAPPLDVIERAIAAAPLDELYRLRAFALLIERGTDNPGDIDRLLEMINSTKHALNGGASASLERGPTEQKSPHAAEPSILKKRKGANASLEPATTQYSEDKASRPKHHIYGGKAALTVEMDYLKSRDGVEPRQTIALEAAVKKGERYDWEHKIIFQFMHRELPLLACKLLGWLEADLRLGNHGGAGDKAVEVIDQVGNLFVRVREGTRMIPVPVVGPDVHAWFELVMRAMNANAPNVGDALQLAMLKRVADMENSRNKNGPR